MALALFDCRPGELTILATRRRCEPCIKTPCIGEANRARLNCRPVEGSRLTSGCWVWWSDFA